MGYKKVAVCSLLVGAIIAFEWSMLTNSLDYKLHYLRRKSNCLNRRVNKVLKSMSEDNLKKYKEEIVNGYENIKNKIDSLTIGDIKQKGNELVSNIVDSIEDLKDKLIAYSK